MPQKKSVYYVVHRGRVPGIYETWNECKIQVEKFDGAQFKKFDNEFEAKKFLERGFGGGSGPIVPKSLKIKNALETKNQKSIDNALDDEDGLEKIFIYTDGSLIREDKNCYSGYGYYIPSKNVRVSKALPDKKITNNRAELRAIIESVGTLTEEEKRTKKICIFTDSQYSIYLFTGTGERYERNEWKNDRGEDVPNPDLIIELLNIKRTYPNVHLLKIRAHTDATDEHSRGNSIADNLANEGAMKMKSKIEQHPMAKIRSNEVNPFRQEMFGERYRNDEFERKMLEEAEFKVSKIKNNMKKEKKEEERISDLFEPYQTNREEIEEKRNTLIKKKTVEKRLTNTNLKSWFVDDNNND